MPLSAGTRPGPYEVVAPIGAGGMDEVWKTRDTRLDRTVASADGRTLLCVLSTPSIPGRSLARMAGGSSLPPTGKGATTYIRKIRPEPPTSSCY